MFILPAAGIFTSVANGPGTDQDPWFAGALTLFSMNYYLLYGAHSVAPAFVIYWSLAVEEHFYIVWSTVLRFVGKHRTRFMLAVLVCVVFCINRFVASATKEARGMDIYFSTHYRIDAILWGALAALTFEQIRGWKITRRLCLALFATTVTYLMHTRNLSLIPGSSPIGISAGYTLTALLFVCIVTEVADCQQGRLAAWLSVKPLAWTGKISYGMYLLHYQCIDIVLAVVRPAETGSVGSVLLVFVLAAALTGLVANGMYAAVEAPLLKLGKAWSHPGAQTTPAVAGPDLPDQDRTERPVHRIS
jgi:peptidoglycan/LPS O-acetylase OafA/YrhL